MTIYRTSRWAGQSDDRDRRQTHPTLGSGVVVGSGAQVLGPIEVGEGARSALTRCDPRRCAGRDHGRKSRPSRCRSTRPLQSGFVPYGTPCGKTSIPAGRGSASWKTKSGSFARSWPCSRRSPPRRRNALERSGAVPNLRDRRAIATFDRLEMQRIFDLYGRMVAAAIGAIMP